MYKYALCLLIGLSLIIYDVSGLKAGAKAENKRQDKIQNIVKDKNDYLSLEDSVKVVEIRAYGTDLSYDITKIEAKAGQKLTIQFINESDMPHNVVVVTNRDNINPVGIAALEYTKNEYIPENELDKITAFTSLARPGETVEVTFTVPPPGTYPYICTYPGHFTSMRGELISTE